AGRRRGGLHDLRPGRGTTAVKQQARRMLNKSRHGPTASTKAQVSGSWVGGAGCSAPSWEPAGRVAIRPSVTTSRQGGGPWGGVASVGPCACRPASPAASRQPSNRPYWERRRGFGRLGRMLRWVTAGESHGPALVAVLEGLPAGVSITSAEIAAELARRRAGYGRGARMKFEQDEVEITGGVRHGQTMGGPVAIRIGNTEWPKWETVMSADPVDPEVLAAQARNAPLTRPRPGHADLAGMQKYGVTDARPILERASARETAARVAMATVARAFLSQALGAEVLSHVVGIGTVTAPEGGIPTPADREAVQACPVRCFDSKSSQLMVEEIDATRRAGDTLGGVVEVVVYGLPPGLGSFVQSDRRLDAR